MLNISTAVFKNKSPITKMPVWQPTWQPNARLEAINVFIRWTTLSLTHVAGLLCHFRLWNCSILGYFSQQNPLSDHYCINRQMAKDTLKQDHNSSYMYYRCGIVNSLALMIFGWLVQCSKPSSSSVMEVGPHGPPAVVHLLSTPWTD